jgi:hypothetical protein
MQYIKLLYCTVLYCTVLYCTVLYCTVLYCTLVLPASTVLYGTEIVEGEREHVGTTAVGTSSGAPVVCAVGWNSWYLVCPTPSQPLPQEGNYTAGRGAPAGDWCTIHSILSVGLGSASASGTP